MKERYHPDQTSAWTAKRSQTVKQRYGVFCSLLADKILPQIDFDASQAAEIGNLLKTINERLNTCDSQGGKVAPSLYALPISASASISCPSSAPSRCQRP